VIAAADPNLLDRWQQGRLRACNRWPRPMQTELEPVAPQKGLERVSGHATSHARVVRDARGGIDRFLLTVPAPRRPPDAQFRNCLKRWPADSHGRPRALVGQNLFFGNPGPDFPRRFLSHLCQKLLELPGRMGSHSVQINSQI